jgi:hypothetical protein
LAATSSSACVIARGVRSSCEALAVPPFQLDPVGERSACRRAGGGGDPRQRREHAAGQDPPADQAEHQQGRQREDRRRAEGGRAEVVRVEGAREVGEPGDEHAGGPVPQQEHPDGGEQQGARDHEEAGVAERELEASAHVSMR